MKETDIKNAELALIMTLFRPAQSLKQGTLRGKIEKLSAEATKEISKLKRPTKKSTERIRKAMEDFISKTGWDVRQRNIQTYVNSILLIIEKRNYRKINRLLVDIMDYQERLAPIPAGCYWSAELVEKKWRDCFY